MKCLNACLLSLSLFLASFTSGAASAAEAKEAGPYVYLLCYSTSLQLDDKSLMTSTDGQVYGISFFADEHILMSSGESCAFVVTDVKGKESPNSVRYVANIPFLSNVVPGDFYNAVPATKDSGDWFRLQYDYFGDFQAVFFLNEKKFGFSPTIWLN
jgi:hypothetical protein